MAKLLKKGDLIKVRDWEGKTLTRVVVKDCGKLIFVCTKEELENADREGREPLSVGWPCDALAW